MKRTRRTAQVGDLIRAEIAAIIRDELRDPHLGFVTVTGVEVAPDLKLARVYVSTLGEKEDEERNVAILQKARGRIRHWLGQRITLRYTPELDFRADRTAAYASSIEKILRDVMPPQEKKEEEAPQNDDDDTTES